MDSVPLSEFTLLGIHMLPLFSLQVNLISRRVLLQLMIVCVIFVKHIFHCTSWFGTNAHCFSINISLNCLETLLFFVFWFIITVLYILLSHDEFVMYHHCLFHESAYSRSCKHAIVLNSDARISCNKWMLFFVKR